MFSDSDGPEFKRRLAEAIAWCMPRASAEDPAGSTRFPAFAPENLHGEYPHLTPFNPTLFREDVLAALQRREEIVAQLAGQRRRLLADGDGIVAPPLPIPFTGRLLLLRFDLQIADGLSMSESAGFFDIYDTPGWDTWVWYEVDWEAARANRERSEFLVSWMPPSFIEHAEQGIRVNCVNCLTWANDSEFAEEPLVQFLRREGFA